jgi:hypothetical protein
VMLRQREIGDACDADEGQLSVRPCAAHPQRRLFHRNPEIRAWRMACTTRGHPSVRNLAQELQFRDPVQIRNHHQIQLAPYGYQF